MVDLIPIVLDNLFLMQICALRANPVRSLEFPKNLLLNLAIGLGG